MFIGREPSRWQVSRKTGMLVNSTWNTVALVRKFSTHITHHMETSRLLFSRNQSRLLSLFPSMWCLSCIYSSGAFWVPDTRSLTDAPAVFLQLMMFREIYLATFLFVYLDDILILSYAGSTSSYICITSHFKPICQTFNYTETMWQPKMGKAMYISHEKICRFLRHWFLVQTC